jgi:hypothetical protein
MVLEMIRGGGWFGKAIAQRRPRVSKLGLKGLSNYHSNEIAVETARWGASGPNKKGWTTALSLTEQGQKAAHQKKIPLIRESYSL